MPDGTEKSYTKGTDTKQVGNIVTQAQAPTSIPKIDRDTIGQGTTEGVPGHPTRLTTPLSDLRKK